MPDISNTDSIQKPTPLRVGLIGVTGYAFAYFEELTKLVKLGLVEWGAVTIINRKDTPECVAFFESEGIPIYDDYHQMLEHESDKLDWVCVPTAIGWHTRRTIDSLSKGIPVLLEKPMAPTLQDVEAIQAAERESGLVVAIGYQHSYSQNTWEIKRRLVNGDIGEIRRIDGLALWARGQAYYSRNDWCGRLHDGESWVLDSPLHNALSHIANLILFFAGSTLEGRADLVEVEAELYRAKPIESYDTVRTEVQLDTGISAALILSHSAEERLDPEIRIVGSKGTFVWRFREAHSFEIGDQVETLPNEEQISIRQRMFENVVKLIGGDTSARTCSTEQAKGEVKWVNAVQDAAAIHDIPAEFRCQIEDLDGDVVEVIDNLGYFAKRAYKEQCSFADLNAPWAVSPGRLEVRGYTAFQGLNIPSPVPPVVATVTPPA